MNGVNTPALLHAEKGITQKSDFSSTEKIWQFSQILAKAGELVPATFKGSPEKIFVAINLGLELGLKPLQALRSIYVINGRPALYSETMLAIVKASGLLEYIKEYTDDKGTAICEVKRKGEKIPVVRYYSDQDANSNPNQKNQVWQTYRSRMKMIRARSYALKDCFPDLLGGICSEVEMQEQREDYSSPDAIETTVVEANPQVNTGYTNVIPKTNSQPISQETPAQAEPKQEEAQPQNISKLLLNKFLSLGVTSKEDQLKVIESVTGARKQKYTDEEKTSILGLLETGGIELINEVLQKVA